MGNIHIKDLKCEVRILNPIIFS